VALVDADLDLDPSAVPSYLEVARRERLDLVVGSKRHPESEVQYPRSRRVASWGFQQLVRVLFSLDVRDTQVGLKVFSRDVADRVVPLLLVKRFAFDLELLAVARSLGYGRVREMPVRLDYRFTGSGVGSRAVARALLDTAAIFYRLRILRTYARRRALLGPRPRGLELPLVSVLSEPAAVSGLDYERLELVPPDSASGELVAVVAPGARPASNWLRATVPYFAAPDVAAVVVPELTPPTATLRERAAAAVLESRLGGGSRRSRYFPGNVHVTEDHVADSVVVCRSDYEAARAGGIGAAELVSWLSERGRRTVYTPDTLVSVAPEPLFRPHLRSVFRHAVSRGRAARRSRGGSLSSATLLSLVPAAGAAVGLAALASGDTRRAGSALVAVYAALTGVASLLASLRFRSLRVGLLAAPALVLSQAAYVGGFLRGLVR
jgi:hypothetical protein